VRGRVEGGGEGQVAHVRAAVLVGAKGGAEEEGEEGDKGERRGEGAGTEAHDAAECLRAFGEGRHKKSRWGKYYRTTSQARHEAGQAAGQRDGGCNACDRHPASAHHVRAPMGMLTGDDAPAGGWGDHGTRESGEGGEGQAGEAGEAGEAGS
jgi:hypothetical protein